MTVTVRSQAPLTLPHTTVEPIYAAVRTGFPGDTDEDPTSFPVFAFMVSDLSLVPSVGDSHWSASTWTTSEGAHYATMPYNGSLPAGEYNMWVKINVASGNNPIRGPKRIILE